MYFTVSVLNSLHVIVHAFVVVCFPKLFFPKNYLRHTIRVSNELAPDQDRHSDLAPKVFAKVISSQKKLLLLRKELKCFGLILYVFWFDSLRPINSYQVMSRQSVHLTTLFLGQLD